MRKASKVISCHSELTVSCLISLSIIRWPRAMPSMDLYLDISTLWSLAQIFSSLTGQLEGAPNSFNMSLASLGAWSMAAHISILPSFMTMPSFCTLNLAMAVPKALFMKQPCGTSSHFLFSLTLKPSSTVMMASSPAQFSNFTIFAL